ASAGTLALEKDYIMAQVISEPGNPNLETNPHTAWNMVDLTENDKTAYIQSLDGKYGFRVKMDSADDATALPRYATVKLSLAGLTMEREENPARYTLRGFTPINVLECEPGNASMLPVKEKYIKDLTDDDMYTYVTFKDMEVAFRYGAWGNHHESFALKSDVIPTGNATQTRNDCMPRYFRDSKGGTIPMVINAQVPWRRPGSYVPKGSGTIKGIVVYSPLSNYNKNNEMGRYQFRVLDKSEINLDANTSSFSNIIAEWQWTGGSSTIMVDGSSDRVINANLGKGQMSTSAKPEGTLKSLTTSFLYKAFPATSTSEYLAFRYNAKWWNFTKNEGHNVSWTFSTEGITGTDRHLSFAMVASIGKQGQPNNGSPARWNLEYSTDGENFTVLKKDFYLYPSPIFAYTLGDIPAGNPEYVFDLPDSLLGQKSVTVRIKATSRKFATSAGIEAGTITNGNATTDVATYLRFESIVIRYNK
ncbi:MAG: hypothetical protein K2M76_06705, partial [Muribaculaceae bacterium]|nr:hypothetical protein [Muribaculaceae bacterium]